MALHDTERVLGMFRAAGLKNASVEVVNVPVRPPGDVAAAARIACSVGPAARILYDKGGTRQDAEAIAARVAAEYEQYLTPEGVLVPTRLNYYSAEVG